MQVVDVSEPTAEEPPEDDEDVEVAGDEKKKKKKKKKKGGGNNTTTATDASASTTTSAAPTEDGAARLQTTLEALRGESGAPVPAELALSRCGFGDKKLRQLLAALKSLGSGCAVLSLDLSHNLVSDAGATALCTALATDLFCAPRLTLLSLDGNPLSADAAAACADALEKRPDLSIVLPAPPASATNGGKSTAADAAFEVSEYFGSRGVDDVTQAVDASDEAAKLARAVSQLAGQGEDPRANDKPTLAGKPMSFEDCTAILLQAASSKAGAGESVEVVDALRSLAEKVDAECEALKEGGSSNSASTKFLPKALKWLSLNMPVLHELLQPPPRPRVSYGGSGGGGASASRLPSSDDFTHRVGRRRLVIIELLCTLIGARRPPLTNALADVRPPLVSTALSLLPLHPRSSILSESLVRLLNAALGAKPLRAPLLVSGGVGCPSVPALVAQNLSVTPPREKTQHMLSRVSRPVWFELASSLEKLSASDKQAAEKLNAEPSWVTLAAALPNMRAELPSSTKWQCGDPPAREGARSIGEDSEMGQLLRLLQQNRM